MHLISVTIPSWEKFNPRADRANYTWFRFQNDFFQDHKLFGLSDSQVILFQMLLCERSKANKNTIDINLDLLSAYRRQPVKRIIEDIQALENIGVIKAADCRRNDGEQPASLPATNVTNERNERTNNNAQAEAFADFYAGYPRKIGKADAEKAFKREMKSGIDPGKIMESRDRFRKHHEKLGTDPKFIPYPATFLSGWRDWEDPENGSSDLTGPKPISIVDILREQNGGAS